MGFDQKTFEGMQLFHSIFTEGKSIIEYRSSSNLEINHNLFTELWPCFDLGLGKCQSYIGFFVE